MSKVNPNNYKTSFDENNSLADIYDRFPYDPNLKDKALELRKNMTKHERYLWYKHLSKHHVRFQKQKIIDHYIVDFYCAKASLVIEVDGESHILQGQEVYDENRTKALESYGLQVLRFTNLEIEVDFERVCGVIDSVVS